MTMEHLKFLCVFFHFDLFLYWTTYAYWVIRSICVLCFMGPFRDNHTESESACRTRIWILLKHLQMRDTQIDYFWWQQQQQQKVKEIEKFFLLKMNTNKMRQIEKKTFEFQTLICSVTICVSNHWWRNSWIFLSKVWNNKNNKVFIPFYGRSWIWIWYRKKNWNQKKKQWKEKKRYKIYGHCVVNAIYKKTWSNQIQRQWIWIKKNRRSLPIWLYQSHNTNIVYFPKILIELMTKIGCKRIFWSQKNFEQNLIHPAF